MRVIQLVPVAENNTLYILDFTDEGEMTFRTATSPKTIQREKVLIDKDVVYTTGHLFPLVFLQKFLKEREE